jgi:hypothetical protein
MTEEVLGWVLWGTFIVLLYAYGYEYYRYKTLKPKPKRRFHYLLFGWMSLIGIVAMVRNPFIGIIVLLLAAMAYAWDRYIVDKMS